jgi:uncharacterized protein (DUF433 family)
MANHNDDRGHLERITVDAKILVGKPVIKGTRLSVEFILGLLAHGMTAEEILAEYQGLVREDILACLSFAAQAVGDSSFISFDSEVA